MATFTSGRAPSLPDLKSAEEKSKANSDDMQAADEYAFALMRSRRLPQARKIADAVLAKEPERPLSNVIVALMNAKAGKPAEAIETLTILRDVGDPHREVLAALCALAGHENDWDAVLETAQRGRRAFPRDALFATSAAKACEELGNTKDLPEIFEVLVVLDQDDPAARRKLAKIKLATGDPATAKKWAADSLLIDVTSVETQELLGQACVALREWPAAERAFATALELEPGRVESQLGLVESYAQTDRKDKARELLDAVQKVHPGHAGVEALRSRLGI